MAKPLTKWKDTPARRKAREVRTLSGLIGLAYNQYVRGNILYSEYLQIKAPLDKAIARERAS